MTCRAALERLACNEPIDPPRQSRLPLLGARNVRVDANFCQR